MKKRFLASILTISMVVSVLAGVDSVDSNVYAIMIESTEAQNTMSETGNYQYVVKSDGTAELTSYTGNESNVNILAAIDGYKVTSIGVELFKDNAFIQNLVIPNTVETIGAKAFYNCPQLLSAGVPKSVTSMGEYSFGYNSMNEIVKDFKMVVLAESHAEEYAKKNNIDFLSLGILNGKYDCLFLGGAVAIHKYNGNDSILEVPEKIYGKPVMFIYQEAFANNQMLKTVILPNTIDTIYERTFMSCSKLESVNLGSGVKKIHKEAFLNCPKLMLIAIPESIVEIGEYALGHNESHVLMKKFKIVGYTYTAAETYAKEYGIPFNDLGEEENTPVSVKFTSKKFRVNLKKGKKATLKVRVTGAKKVKFTTSKKRVVKIVKKYAKKVVVKGLKKGKAYIWARTGKEYDFIKVVVK